MGCGASSSRPLTPEVNKKNEDDSSVVVSPQKKMFTANPTFHAEREILQKDTKAILERLISGNERYRTGNTTECKFSFQRLADCAKRQSPLAIIVSCSDSRVVPELAFDCGIGDLFVVRIAGHVLDANAAGSIEYAVENIGVKLVVVLSHTHCGAVKGAIAQFKAKYHTTGDIAKMKDGSQQVKSHIKEVLSRVASRTPTQMGSQVSESFKTPSSSAVATPASSAQSTPIAPNLRSKAAPSNLSRLARSSNHSELPGMAPGSFSNTSSGTLRSTHGNTHGGELTLEADPSNRGAQGHERSDSSATTVLHLEPPSSPPPAPMPPPNANANPNPTRTSSNNGLNPGLPPATPSGAVRTSTGAINITPRKTDAAFPLLAQLVTPGAGHRRSASRTSIGKPVLINATNSPSRHSIISFPRASEPDEILLLEDPEEEEALAGTGAVRTAVVASASPLPMKARSGDLSPSARIASSKLGRTPTVGPDSIELTVSPGSPPLVSPGQPRPGAVYVNKFTTPAKQSHHVHAQSFPELHEMDVSSESEGGEEQEGSVRNRTDYVQLKSVPRHRKTESEGPGANPQVPHARSRAHRPVVHLVESLAPMVSLVGGSLTEAVDEDTFTDRITKISSVVAAQQIYEVLRQAVDPEKMSGVLCVPALYDLETGSVDFFSTVTDKGRMERKSISLLRHDTDADGSLGEVVQYGVAQILELDGTSDDELEAAQTAAH